MPPRDRRIIVDATFPWRIADELVRRGDRGSTSPHQLGDASMKDPALLRLISDDLEPAVLVTFDNKMPLEHRSLIDALGTTLAVIDKDDRPPERTTEEYWRDVIHRHAHRFADQDAGSLWKYRRAARRRVE